MQQRKNPSIPRASPSCISCSFAIQKDHHRRKRAPYVCSSGLLLETLRPGCSSCSIAIREACVGKQGPLTCPAPSVSSLNLSDMLEYYYSSSKHGAHGAGQDPRWPQRRLQGSQHERSRPRPHQPQCLPLARSQARCHWRRPDRTPAGRQWRRRRARAARTQGLRRPRPNRTRAGSARRPPRCRTRVCPELWRRPGGRACGRRSARRSRRWASACRCGKTQTS